VSLETPEDTMKQLIPIGVIATIITGAFMFGSTGLSFLGALGATAMIGAILITFAVIVGQ